MTLRVVFAAAALTAFTGTAIPQEPETGSVIVRLGDGSQVLLRAWSFSYEYSSRRRGEGMDQGATARRPSRDFWYGKRMVPTTGLTLEIQYAEDRPSPLDEPRARVRSLAIVAPDGRKTTSKLEPPPVDFLLPGASGMIVSALSLDIRGETLGGTRREFCLLSYSDLVQCGNEAAQRVVKVEFQP